MSGSHRPDPCTVARTIPPGGAFSRWTAPDGWDLRRFDRAAGKVPPRGSILFQGGRGDMPEKYLESFAHWHDRGWNLTSLDWRGQAGSGRCGTNPLCGHVDSFDRYVLDFEAFVRQWRAATPGPHVVIGHSMGGHLVLKALVERAIDCDVAVLVAPMLGLKGPVPSRLAARVSHWMTRIGAPDRPAWKANERPHTTATRQSLLTHDADRYADELFWQANDPRLMTGPPSWAWVAEAYRSTAALARDDRLAAMATPLLALIADADGLVDPAAARGVVARLPDAAMVRFGDEAAHELLREVDVVRDRALAAIDSFLDDRVPTP